MEATAETLQRSREFADKCGVTVRALHLYDRIGLLKPAGRTRSGHRLYGSAELERLEQILALRFAGFRLKEMNELLGGPRWPLVVALRMQREIVSARKRRLESAVQALDDAERILCADPSADRWTTLRTVMEAFQMKDEHAWTQRYFSEAARSKVDAKAKETPREIVEQGQRDWAALIAEVEEAAARGEDPKSLSARALARRWRELVRSFTGGDAEIHRGLNRLWSDSKHWPPDFKRPWSDAADRFVKDALDCPD